MRDRVRPEKPFPGTLASRSRPREPAPMPDAELHGLPSDPTPLVALRERLVAVLARAATDFGLDPRALQVAYVPNWGGFVNASFRAFDGTRAIRVKLAKEADTIARLRRWHDLAPILHARYRAPRMLGWLAVPGTAHEGPLFEWIDGEVPSARGRDLAREFGPILEALHADAELAARLGAESGRRTCRDAYLGGLHRRFLEDLAAVTVSPPPFLGGGDLEWMRDEVARLAADAWVEPAFEAPLVAPCHGDLWSENLLRSTEGRLTILDWDDLALGDPALDWALLLGPTRGDLRPAGAADLPARLAADLAFRARFDLLARASLFDWALDGLADWIEAGVLGPGASEVRREKERVSLAALEAYRRAYRARVREFGVREPGRSYRPRPGCYALALDAEGRVAAMSTRKGWCLPGGGAEPGETQAQTLAREVREECGRTVEIVRPLGRAIECVHAAGEGDFAKDCAFFEVRLGDVVAEPIEDDHRLEWLPVREALARLEHRSQTWAVARLLLAQSGVGGAGQALSTPVG